MCQFTEVWKTYTKKKMFQSQGLWDVNMLLIWMLHLTTIFIQSSPVPTWPYLTYVVEQLKRQCLIVDYSVSPSYHLSLNDINETGHITSDMIRDKEDNDSRLRRANRMMPSTSFLPPSSSIQLLLRYHLWFRAQRLPRAGQRGYFENTSPAYVGPGSSFGPVE